MGLDIAPEDQDKLAQLFGGKLGGNVADLFARGAGATPPSAAMPIPGMPQSAPVAAPPAVQASDDPAITGQAAPTSPMPGTAAPPPKLPTVPTFQQPPLGTMQDLSKNIATASQPVRRQDYKPHWWERLLAPAVAAVAGYGDEKGGVRAGNAVLNRRYNVAVENQKKTVTPLEAEFERQSKIEPYLRDTNENSQRTFSDQDAVYKNWNATQDRQEATEQRRDAASERDDARQQEQNRKDEEDQNTPAPNARPELYLEKGKPALRIRTKSGDFIPYIPKSIDEGAMLGDKTATSLYNRAHPGREGKGDKEASKAKFEQIEKDHQKALNDAEDEYTKEIGDLDQMKRTLSHGGKAAPDDSAARGSANQRLQQKKDRAEKTYQAEIVAAGGKINDADRRAPNSASGAGDKSVPKATVQSYADSHKVGNRQMTYDEALQGFQSKGYKVQ